MLGDAEEARGQVAALGDSRTQGPQGETEAAPHFSTMSPRFYFNPQRTWEEDIILPYGYPQFADGKLRPVGGKGIAQGHPAG